MVWAPGGATLPSYAVWKYSSHHLGLGMPWRAVSHAAWVTSVPLEMVTMPRYGGGPSYPARLAATKLGSRLSPQLILTTGLSMLQPATRSAKAAKPDGGSPPAAWHIARVRLGSALLTTAAAGMTSPPSSATAGPSPERMAATGTPWRIKAPASVAASARARETRPMPPAT